MYCRPRTRPTSRSSEFEHRLHCAGAEQDLSHHDEQRDGCKRGRGCRGVDAVGEQTEAGRSHQHENAGDVEDEKRHEHRDAEEQQSEKQSNSARERDPPRHGIRLAVPPPASSRVRSRMKYRPELNIPYGMKADTSHFGTG